MGEFGAGKVIVKATPLNDHTALNMEYVWTVTVSFEFSKAKRREEVSREETEKRLLFGSRKNL